jgi:predicted enzyme related to lactoylglutathione lyase
MTLQHVNTSVDCADAQRVGTFWSQALGRPLAEGASQFFAMIPATAPGEVSWLFMGVPEAKTAKNRMHVDFSSTDRAADVARLIGLGATLVGEYDEYGVRWTTLRDVEGNEFCVSDPHTGLTGE